jgi:hypothetical protein
MAYSDNLAVDGQMTADAKPSFSFGLHVDLDHEFAVVAHGRLEVAARLSQGGGCENKVSWRPVHQGAFPCRFRINSRSDHHAGRPPSIMKVAAVTYEASSEPSQSMG